MLDQPVRVLLIDDDEDSHVITESLLLSVPKQSYKLDVVDNQDDGLSVIARKQHDVYLVDYNLGPDNGLDLIRKAIAEGCRRPLILITGQAGDELDQEALQSGAADYLLKDELSGRSLAKAIRHALDRQRLVNALKDSEALYHSLVNQLPLKVFRKDLEGRFTFGNTAFCDDMGHSLEELAGKTDYDFFPKELGDKYRADDERVVAERSIFTDTEEHIDAEGNRQYVQVVKTPVQNAASEVIGTQGAFWDVTDRVRAEEAVRVSEALYHSLVEYMPMSVFRKDREGRFVFGNANVCEDLGTTPEEIVGKTDIDFTTPELAAKYRADDVSVMDMEREFRDVEEHIDADGVKRFIEVLKTPVFDYKGEVVGVQGMYRNVTDRVRAEQQLKNLAAALERSNNELQQFAYVASHDLQEPLRMVASYCQLLREQYADHFDEEGRTFINYAVDGALRMQKLITDLLSFSRVETQGRPFKPVNCNKLIDTIRRDLEIQIEEAGAVVTYDELPVINGDRTQLNQLFLNLITNAIKFCGDAAPRVQIAATREGLNWRFDVTDNGIGIDPALCDQIFELFGRLHTREDYPGTGIGLAVCKKVVERHGGRIWVDTSPAGGSAFRFTLPADNESKSNASRD